MNISRKQYVQIVNSSTLIYQVLIYAFHSYACALPAAVLQWEEIRRAPPGPPLRRSLTMKVLIWGGEARYRADLPHAVQSLPLELVFCPREQPLESMFPQHADTVFLFVDAIAPVDDALMDRMPGLRLIHSEGVAYNAIDLDAARRRSIFVCNNKGCNAAPTAEMAVMLMLMSLRFGIPGDRAVREGRQIRFKEGVMASGGPELGERTVGLVGFGDIAQAVARRLRPFGCSLFYYAPHRRPPEVEAGFGISYLPLEALFARCDLISLHCAVTHETRGMVDAALLERVRPGTILINTGPGRSSGQPGGPSGADRRPAGGRGLRRPLPRAHPCRPPAGGPPPGGAGPGGLRPPSGRHHLRFLPPLPRLDVGLGPRYAGGRPSQ